MKSRKDDKTKRYKMFAYKTSSRIHSKLPYIYKQTNKQTEEISKKPSITTLNKTWLIDTFKMKIIKKK